MREYFRSVVFTGSLLLAGCGESASAAVPAPITMPDNCPKPVSLGVYDVEVAAEGCFPGRLRFTHAAVSPLLKFEAEQDLKGALRFIQNQCGVTGSTYISIDQKGSLYSLADVRNPNCLNELGTSKPQ